jgi:hypothetical protein
MVARHERQLPNERAINDRPYGFVRYLFVYANSPINQNLKSNYKKQKRSLGYAFSIWIKTR